MAGGRRRGRHQHNEAGEPAGVQRDDEWVAAGVRLDCAAAPQPRRVMAGLGEFSEPLQSDERKSPIERRHRLSSSRNPAVKPGPSAFINAKFHRGGAASSASSTNITVAADMLP